MNSIDENFEEKGKKTQRIEFPKCIGIDRYYELMKDPEKSQKKEENPETNYQELQGTHYWVG